MAISQKAVFDYSATAAITTAWSLTANTSIAVGDTILLHVAYRQSASSTVSAVTDNAGNVWTRVAVTNNLARTLEVWAAPVTTVTSNFQIAIAGSGTKSMTARAAHVIVLSGAHATAPIDLGSVKFNSVTGSVTYTVSVSLTTTLDAARLFVAALHQQGSATMFADAAWATVAGPTLATGGASTKLYSWDRAIAAPAIYNFSASMSDVGVATTAGIIYAVREAAAADSLTGTATLSFAPTGTMEADADYAGSATLAFDVTGVLSALTNMALDSTLTFAVSGVLDDAGAGSATATASVATQAPITYGGWDPRAFRRLLMERRRKVLAEARAALKDRDVPAPVAREASVVAQKALALHVAPAADPARLKAQEIALAAMSRQLQTIAQAIEDDEDDELLLIAEAA